MENYFEKSKIVSFLKWIFFIPLGFVSYYIGMTILNLAVVLVLSFFSLKDMLGGVLNSALGILGLLLIIYLYHYLAKFALAVMPNKSKSIPILIILLTIFQVFSVLVKGNI